ncbi:MAG: CopD family protein [Gammaproteobacteria bacterium]|nr:CopD family protein [Gammaproteobacteria bacterium]
MNALAPYYLIFKALHVAFMVTWFAGLFYLPRLFIYHTEASDAVGRQRFMVMENRLFGIMTIGAVLTAVFGVVLLGINHALIVTAWFQVKLALIVGLIVYHYRCYGWIVRLRETDAKADSRWLRWFNEIPVIFLLSIIILAVTKAF